MKSKGRKTRRLTWCRQVIKDHWDERYYTAITCSVLEPSVDYPMACIHVSVANGIAKVLFRVPDVEMLKTIIVLAPEHEERLRESLAKANTLVDQIESEMRLIFEKRKLPPGTRIARTDTGEIIAEAERILYDAEKQ